MLSMDISKHLRSDSPLGSIGVLREISEQVGAAIWDQFETLVNETPQWSGTAAASWNLEVTGIATGHALGEGGVREQPELPRSEALQKGHPAAVNVALGHSSFLTEIGNGLFHPGTALPRGAIGVWNSSDSIDRAEHGSLRDVNKPPGAFQRFEASLGGMSIDLRSNDYSF